MSQAGPGQPDTPKDNQAFMPEPEGAREARGRQQRICPARHRQAGPPSRGPMARQDQHPHGALSGQKLECHTWQTVNDQLVTFIHRVILMGL